MKAAIRLITHCLTALAVSGCASMSPVEVGQLPPDVAFPDYDSWQFRGRVSLTRGEEGWHAGVNWQEDAGVFDLQLSGPLGQGAVQVKGKEGLVRLTAANGQVIIANDADALVADVTGWPFRAGATAAGDNQPRRGRTAATPGAVGLGYSLHPLSEHRRLELADAAAPCHRRAGCSPGH